MAQADEIKREIKRLRTEAKAAGTKDRLWKTIAAVTSAIALVSSGDVGWDATHFGAGEDRKKESREKRAQVYADYLAAVRNSYDAARALNQSAEGYDPAKGGAKAEAKINLAIDRFRAADLAWRRQLDLVYVYGGDDAWRVALTTQDWATDTVSPGSTGHRRRLRFRS